MDELRWPAAVPAAARWDHPSKEFGGPGPAGSLPLRRASPAPSASPRLPQAPININVPWTVNQLFVLKLMDEVQVVVFLERLNKLAVTGQHHSGGDWNNTPLLPSIIELPAEVPQAWPEGRNY